MNTTVNRTPIAHRRSRSSLTWVDFLVIAAIIVTFAAIVSTTVGRARASTYNNITPSVSTEIGDAHIDSSLIKARLRLATGGPWG
ncbi:MAG: hypothetical protein JOY64_00955 [Alphaproteobacteria bacterium]|nr:hypothetical protein [Alphaproteobacteria bacterium]MBV8406169.1 hypothetical protein [Alphaproteobacteria bacterium]